MNNLKKTLSNCELQLQKHFEYKIKLLVVPHDTSILSSILDYCLLQTLVSKSDLLDGKQTRRVADARKIYCYLAKQNTKYSLSEIGRFINKDHATVCYSIKTVENLLKIDKIFKNKYSQIINEFTTIPAES
jgi:chromosomal replication initiation ATPase DnaA